MNRRRKPAFATVFVLLVERTDFSDDAPYVQSVWNDKQQAWEGMLQWKLKHADGWARVEGPFKVACNG